MGDRTHTVVLGNSSDTSRFDISPHWRQLAQCRTDPDLFFADDDPSIQLAKKICAGCSVRSRCLEWALAAALDHGVAAGLTAYERRVLASGGEKRCTVCGATKALMDFSKDGQKPDGVRPQCKDCVRVDSAQRMTRLVEAKRARRRAARARGEVAA